MTQTTTLGSRTAATAARSSMDSARASRPHACDTRRRSEPRRRLGALLVCLGLLGLYLNVAVYSESPVAIGAAASGAVPADARTAVSESELASSDLVALFEDALADGRDAINVTPWVGGLGEDAVVEAFVTAMVLQPDHEVDGWDLVADGATTLLTPRYTTGS